MFKLIKFIFKLIGIIVLILTILPIVLLIMMYSDISPNEDTYPATTISFTDVAADRFDDFLADDQTEAIELIFSTDEVNASIKTLLLESNPNFMSTDPNVDNDDKTYATKIANIGYKGSWIEFIDDGFTLISGIDLDLGFMKYKSGIKITFELNNDEDTYSFKLKELKIGNLQTLWMYNIADWIVGLTKNDLTEIIQEQLPFGVYDGKEKTLTVTSQELIDLIVKDEDPNKIVIETLVDLVTQNELLAFNFESTAGGLNLNLGLARSSKTKPVITNPIETQNDLNSLFQGQLVNLLLANVNTDGKVYLDLTETMINQVVDYYVGDSLDISYELPLGNKVYVVESSGLFVELADGEFAATIIISLYDKDNPANLFKTHFKLITTPIVSGKDLMLEINDFELGDNIDVPDNIGAILSLLAESDIISDGTIIIEGFFEALLVDDIAVENVFVLNGFMRFELGITNSVINDILDEIQTHLNDALDQLETLYPELSDSIDELLTNQNPQDLINQIGEMSPEEQEQIFEELQDILGVLGVDLNDLLP